MSASQNREAAGVSWGVSGVNPAENYERFFVPAIGAPLAAELIEIAGLRAGERVLDVACGTGVVTRLAAKRVGADGKVAGLDLNPGMLAVARSVTPSNMPVQWYEASAESLPLPDGSFDVVLCQLGLQFVPDKTVALEEMRRVLRPGGRVIMNVPGPVGSLFVVADEAFARHLGQEAAGFLRMVFSLNDTREIEKLIRGAGFRDVDVRRDTKVLRLPPPAEFLWQYVQSTPLVAAAEQAGKERRAALERDVVTKWRQFADDRGLKYQQDIIFATARK